MYDFSKGITNLVEEKIKNVKAHFLHNFTYTSKKDMFTKIGDTNFWGGAWSSGAGRGLVRSGVD